MSDDEHPFNRAATRSNAWPMAAPEPCSRWPAASSRRRPGTRPTDERRRRTSGKPLFVQISDTHIGFNKEANPDVDGNAHRDHRPGQRDEPSSPH